MLMKAKAQLPQSKSKGPFLLRNELTALLSADKCILKAVQELTAQLKKQTTPPPQQNTSEGLMFCEILIPFPWRFLSSSRILGGAKNLTGWILVSQN